jgi:hypothetical protein
MDIYIHHASKQGAMDSNHTWRKKEKNLSLSIYPFPPCDGFKGTRGIRRYVSDLGVIGWLGALVEERERRFQGKEMSFWLPTNTHNIQVL